MSKRIWWGSLVGIGLLLVGGWLVLHRSPVGYQAQRTIQTGQLRATTFALVSSAENSTTAYQRQYRYIQDIGDGRGYTAGIIGFTTGNGDLRQVVLRYRQLRPNNGLNQFLPALRRVQGTASHRGLGRPFVHAWRRAATDQRFVRAQNDILNQQYMYPALRAARHDDLGPLGQYIYYDALVVHGPGNDAASFGGIRRRARRLAQTPAQGGDPATYLRAFLRVRQGVMRQEAAHHDLSRLTTQRQLIRQRNFALRRPLAWTMYGDHYRLPA
ncbi:chitosanase [Levilactobacillus acidifarinae]|uniref:Chitosanase n=1 Tax=Levilactobacillus acidifarinae DSM 19394 = JCM 15949 TaxID=1423715 RepID=A0A0R1LRB7_9LACO|nr:chitosanase [Levilactobacillus acidifarinae]KRK95716.1 csn protein [Levilactobacillus acidifarinae DSM 19394]GEO69452.1 chitosanase [Levilactobacillus acidifarinae]